MKRKHKFIPYEKLSKIEKKELNKKKRTLWEINPVTRCERRYDRNKIRCDFSQDDYS